MRLKSKMYPTLLFPLLIFALIGCSSSGFSTKSNLVVPRTIRAPSDVPPEVAQYAPRFVESLQDVGFLVGETEDPRALDLVFEFNGNPFNLRVSAGLWREGVPILTASATNSGWGTALARGSAVNSLADSAVHTFREELSSLMATASIVPDRFETAPSDNAGSTESSPDIASLSVDEKYDLLERLKKMLDDGALTQDEYNQEKAKILNQK